MNLNHCSAMKQESVRLLMEVVGQLGSLKSLYLNVEKVQQSSLKALRPVELFSLSKVVGDYA